ncbi:MAG: molecular chaperone HtpG [Lachnospiraceae bacterium]|nr:molecular chaperone HtpG [Lachnospiraceae bacterium]
MMAKTGNLSINSENMLPIIKKWLYSDHDIFVREQIANACDAITKLKKLEGVGQYRPEEGHRYEIHVEVNPDEKTLKFIDNGIGMTEDEVVEYITQIAFSGATAFLEKYKDEKDASQIIGHFGLGFYSAFMVADEVHIDTLSYLPDAKPVHWESDGQSTYSISEGSRSTVGTEITLFLRDDSLEFCNEYRVREVLQKYCSFMPTEIYLTDVGSAAKKREEENEKRRIENHEKAVKEAVEKGEEAPAMPEKPVPQPINDTHPLWTKMPSECKDEDYKEFYRNVFHDYKEPLFWIHLKTDYPFNLRGILYFPKINTEYDALEAQIRLYNNQVFIADNIKEVIPEFLMTLKGVIDCPDLPLNVSRSALQNDGTVKKIAEYISRKMADKLSGMCKTERENYEKNWEAISPFIKYGCIRDMKFADKMMEYMLFKDLNGKYVTLSEYKEQHGIADEEKKEGEEAEAAKAVDENGEEVVAEVVDDSPETDEEKEPEKNTIFYVTDEVQQAQYIAMFRKSGKDAVILRERIDQPFIQQLEQRNEKIRFARIDSQLDDEFKGDEVDKADADSLTETFRKHLGNEKLEVRAEKMKDEDVAAIVTLSEESRRLQDMMKMYGMEDMGGMGTEGETLVLNVNHPLVQYVLKDSDGENVPMICEQLYDLARISQRPLTQEEMTKFMKRSNSIMMLLAK